MKQEHIALLNMFFCMGIFWSCICRLNTKAARINRGLRARYSLLLCGALSFGFMPTWAGVWPGFFGLLCSVVVFVALCLNMHKWKDAHASNNA